MTRGKITSRVVLVAFGAMALLYAADFLVLRFRMLHMTVSQPFESLTRSRILAIPQKSGRLDYQIDQLQPVETITCVHAIFPQYGNQPCWYLKPRIDQPIPVN